MRILVSTSDKSGLLEFLEPLKSIGLELVSTGGTFDFLKKNNFEVTEVSAVTGFPEVLGGRVKTLHPFVHMGLLADKSIPEHMDQLKKHNVEPFDMVIGNLYPFEKTAQNPKSSFEDLIENIDIGGPSFLRASAKNYRSVVVLASPLDYPWVQKKILDNSLNDDDRKNLAIKVFSLTAYYDSLIVNKLCTNPDELEYLNLPFKKKSGLRYGENAQQKAQWYANPLQVGGLQDLFFHQGKDLSYNNILDLDAAWTLVQTMPEPACVAVKHNNPCGVAMAGQLFDAAKKTISSDPKSIFGGILAFNRIVDLSTCQLFKDIFLECMIAPGFTDESLSYLNIKKNVRIVSLPNSSQVQKTFKSVSGGILLQDADSFADSEWKFLGAQPDRELLLTMKFGERVAAALKSNAIAIVCNNQTLGLGMGQVNRVDAVKHAIERLNEFKKQNSVDMARTILVSDAFFPFADSIELIATTGIKWVVQPGGSVQDQNVFEAAQKNDMNMVVTQRRHFKH